ncbi:MAG: DUF616 domain-containing protein [Planctomycetaceae bacterium]|nr:DUF616 domain-containing protein [Planctomycetaceae bacterium]
MLTLITPTSDRPRAFALCERWIRRQTYRGPLRWIVVDDGHTPVECTLGQEVTRRPPGDVVIASFLGNLLAGFRRAESLGAEKVLVIEDDDWYSPHYLQQMSAWLDDFELVGEADARYYHVPTGRYRAMQNDQHASLCQSGFRAPVLRWLIENLAAGRQTTSVDLCLWAAAPGRWNTFLQPQTSLGCGTKGLPGKTGIGEGHCLGEESTVDRDGQVLRQWVGEDAAWYRPRIVVYTALFGSRDTLLPVPETGIPHVCFSDAPHRVAGWEVRVVDPGGVPSRRVARRFKVLAHRWFPAADVTIWRDANIEMHEPATTTVARHLFGAEIACFRHPRRDCVYDEATLCMLEQKDAIPVIQRQTAGYRSTGFPAGYGLHETGILLRRNTPEVREFNEVWWQQIDQGSLRDQLSFDFVRWQSGLQVKSLGDNIRDVAEITVRDHADSRLSQLVSGIARRTCGLAR